MKCKECDNPLDEDAPDYEEYTTGADEDRGWVEDIYECWDCPECGNTTKVHVGDRPASGAW